MTAINATNWTGADLWNWFVRTYDNELDATLFGVHVNVCGFGFDAAGADCYIDQAVRVSYTVVAWPTPRDEVHGEPQTSPDACLLEARRILRPFMAVPDYDAWLLRMAQASGLQGALPL